MHRIFTFFLVLLICSCKPNKDNQEFPANDSNQNKSVNEQSVNAKMAPNFVLKDVNGKLVKLSDFKGKYLYVDIWATWCGPCIRQIPAMKELEEKYRNTDIELISVSIDKEADQQKWYDFVYKNQMGGTQLFAGKMSPFSSDYQVKTIPKFLIIGKDGELILDNAPRPMDFRTKEINQELVAILNDLQTKT